MAYSFLCHCTHFYYMGNSQHCIAALCLHFVVKLLWFVKFSIISRRKFLHNECTHASACSANCAQLGTTVVLFVLPLWVSQWPSQIYGTWNQGYDKTGEKPTGFWSVRLCLHSTVLSTKKLCKQIPVHVISSAIDAASQLLVSIISRWCLISPCYKSWVLLSQRCLSVLRYLPFFNNSLTQHPACECTLVVWVT